MAITIADAPNWSLDAYLGLLIAMTGLAGLAEVNAELAEAFAYLVVTVVLLRRGNNLFGKLAGFTGG
jgi:hypothetical protein